MKFRLIVDEQCEEEIVATVHRRSALTDRIEQLVTQQDGVDRLTGFAEDEVRLLPIEQIACVTVQDGKTTAIDADNRRYRLKQRLYEVQATLPACFIRINKSALANVNHLERFAAVTGGAADAVFRCGYREYVSRRCFAEIKRRYES